MFRVISTIFLAAIAVAAYFVIYEDDNFLKTTAETTQEQPVAQTTPKAAVVTPDPVVVTSEPVAAVKEKITENVALNEAEKKQAKEHVASITNQAQEPLEISTANHFVTADQILQLPDLKVPQIAIIETTDSPAAVIVSAPSKDTANLNDVQKNAENAATAQSFAIKMPTFKKPMVATTVVEPASTAVEEKVVAPSSSVVENTVIQNSDPAVENIAKESIVKETTAQNKAIVQAIEITELEKVAITGEQATAKPAAIPPTKLPQISNDKVNFLGTVTGTIPKEPITIETFKVAKTIVVTNNETQSDSDSNSNSNSNSNNSNSNSNNSNSNDSLMTTIKKNLEQLSDIKVSELAQIIAEKVTPQEPEVTPVISNQPKTVTVTAPIDTSKVITSTKSTDQVKGVLKTASVNEKVTANLSENNRIKLRELLSETQSEKKRIFYLHAVNPTDEQGIWGIIQQGLMGTFSKGITLSHANGEVKALIPQDADEILSSKKSSFLGKLLNDKVLTTYVYNYDQGYIGKNPDFIQPGQQLIIVTFTEEELMSVFQHFKNQQ